MKLVGNTFAMLESTFTGEVNIINPIKHHFAANTHPRKL